MITLARFNVFTADNGHCYDVVFPVEMKDELHAKIREQEPEADTIEAALELMVEDLGVVDPVVSFEEVFQRESIDADMTEGSVCVLVLGATPPEDAEWVESLTAP